MKPLIIYGTPTDPHIRRVGAKLAEKRVTIGLYSALSEARLGRDPVSRLSQRSVLQDFKFVLPTVGGCSVEIEAARAVWWLRNKFRLMGVFDETDQRRHFELDTRVGRSGARK